MRELENSDEKEEKLLNEIRNSTDNINIPEALLPENMMKRIRDESKKEKKHSFKYIYTIGLAVASFALCISIALKFSNINNTSKGNVSKSEATEYSESNGSGINGYSGNSSDGALSDKPVSNNVEMNNSQESMEYNNIAEIEDSNNNGASKEESESVVDLEDTNNRIFLKDIKAYAKKILNVINEFLHS